MKSNFCTKAKYLIEYIDFFGIQPSINVFGKQKYSTILGAILTIFVGLATFGYLILEMQELFSKSLPTIIQSDKQVIETSEFPLQNDNFTFAISVANMAQNPLQTINKYFTIEVQNCIRIRTLNSITNKIDVNNTCTTYPTEACSSEDFVTDLQKEYFSKIRLGTVQCIKRDILRNNPPKLQGIVSGNSYAYITVKFSICKNTTENSNCSPLEEIKNGLKNGYYLLHISDALLQMNQPGRISKDIIKLQYRTFSISQSTTIFQGFRIIESLTDDGLITSNINSNYCLIQQSYSEQSNLYNDDYLILHYIILDGIQSQYSRSYIKFQTILSRIGGLWQILFLAIAILIKPFVETEMYIEICNELFRFQSKNSNNSSIHIQSYENNSPDVILGQNNCDNEDSIKTNFTKIMGELNPEFSYNLTDVFCLSIGCKKQKRRQLQMAKQRVQEQVDVVKIINKFYQIDILTNILLSDEQRMIFGFIPKPLIEEEKKKPILDDIVLSSSRSINEVFQFQKERINFEKFLLASKIYGQIYQCQQSQEKIDQRLLMCLDTGMVKLFNIVAFSNAGQKNERLSQQRHQQGKGNQSSVFEYKDDLMPVSNESSAARIFIHQSRFQK